MREATEQWLDSLQPPTGCRALVVRLADETVVEQVWDPEITAGSLQHAARYVNNTLRVMTLHRLPTQFLQWTFAEGTLHCLRREDGVLLIVVSRREPPLAQVILETWGAAFMELGSAE